ncbi:MAG: chemotaxis protein CheA [Rhodopila sp.]
MNELLAQFVVEARDLLRDAGEDLMALERQPDDEDAINRLFRSVHTLKGSSGLFDAQPLSRILHVVEDIFQAVREHKIAVTPELADLALKVLDQAGQWIDYLDRHEVVPDGAGSIAGELVAELRTRYGQRPGEALSEAGAAAPLDLAPPAGLNRWFSNDVLLAASVAARDGTMRLISYAPEDGCFFRGEDPLYLAMQIPLLHALDIEARAPWASITDHDPFGSNLDFHALSMADRADLDFLFRYVPEQVTITELTAAALLDSASPTAPDRALPPVVRALLLDQINLLAMEASAEEFDGRVGAAARVAVNALRSARRVDATLAIEGACAAALAARQTAPLRAAITDILNALPGPPGAADRLPQRTLRVDQEKVDQLMNLIGELVVAKNSLPFLARRAEMHYGLRDLGREIKDQYGDIDRIAQELQSAVMSVRMMPVGQVFQRFPRLVRDLSRKLGKEVNLIIQGEETEADKNVIENLFDPLLHMVRNSLDHGVETPAERAACGKPSTAMVKLLARHEGDQVVLEVVDDGRGIDPAVIKRKAYERGILDEAGLVSITDQEATMLVFAAGFSTVDVISDVSGRGVGMDVVRNAVEKAGGRIAITSTKGVGTTVRLNLPLSMAVSRVMTVSLDDRLFGIPMDLIHGTVKVPRDEVVRIKGREAFVLRERVVPLLHLAQLLDIPQTASPGDEVAVLVVRLDGQTIGLGISAFGEGMEVILKPLEGMLAKIVGYAGTALLGDGRVLLVLDLKELIQ